MSKVTVTAVGHKRRRTNTISTNQATRTRLGLSVGRSVQVTINGATNNMTVGRVAHDASRLLRVLEGPYVFIPDSVLKSHCVDSGVQIEIEALSNTLVPLARSDAPSGSKAVASDSKAVASDSKAVVSGSVEDNSLSARVRREVLSKEVGKAFSTLTIATAVGSTQSAIWGAINRLKDKGVIVRVSDDVVDGHKTKLYRRV